MNHDHTNRSAHRRSLTIALVLVAVFMIIEGLAGWLAGSLALISDAGHMANDALGIGMSLAAVTAAARSNTKPERTFGTYRLEILAALANAVLLFGVATFVLVEAVGRLSDPPAVGTTAMALTAIAGLIVNIVSWRLLRSGARESLNVEGAYAEVLADLLGSIGVVGAAIVIWLTGWNVVDPIVGAAVGLFILPRAWRLGRKAIRVLIQAAPTSLDIAAVERELHLIPDVVDVHDLHVWTLTSEMDVGSAHLMTTADADAHGVLDQARSVLQDAGIGHATIQVEPETHEGCDQVSW